jgi:phage major head subunit gpT-like protein
MTVARAGFSELLAPGLAHVFFQDIETWAPQYKEILKVRGSKRNKEEDLEIVGLGIMDQKAEGTSTAYDDILQGFKATYTHNTYAKAIRITQEMIEDDQYDVMKDMTVALARSAKQRLEVDAANILNNAFSSSFTGLDGVSLINSAHVLKAGGTQSNALSANADLSAASLQEATQVLEDCQDERSLNIALTPKLLVVPTAGQWTAGELLESVKKPGNANNEINVLADKELGYTINRFLTDTDSWYLLADEHKLMMYERVPLSFFKGNDFDTFDCKYAARMRYQVGWSSWRGVTGSAGA